MVVLIVGEFNGLKERGFDRPWVGVGLMGFALQVHGGGDGFGFSSIFNLSWIWIKVWCVGLTN